MDFKKYTLGQNDEGRRLDRICRKFLPSLPLSLIYKNIRSGFIRLNGKKTTAESKTAAGDELWIAYVIADEKQPQTETIQDLQFETVFKNTHIWVINKPYGIPVQKAKSGQLSLDEVIKSRYKTESADTSLSFQPGPLHRLDTCTTGLLAFSQSLAGAQWFSDAIATHTVKKTYIGLVEGLLKSETEWQDSLTQNKNVPQGNFHTMSVSDAGKKAVTIANPISYGKYGSTPVSLVEFRIPTGRTHQIRVQSASHGFPLLGDTAYNSSVNLEKEGFQRYLLHAQKLEIPNDNPIGLPQKLTADFSPQFNHFLSICLIETPNE
ncbi:MAG: RluA family pseudouridine synthase [Spirochaetaceae bacterium]|nr:RluA family pseudouridine synthase [Spirochaetaceae bacterium]